MRFIIILAMAVGMIACQSSGLGKLPPELVELYDTAAEDGSMEIEASRDGTIIEIEADIPVGDLPESIREAAMKQLPGARVTGAEIEIVSGRRGYEVKMAKSGVEYEFVFSMEGELLETEKSLKRSEAPAAVLTAATAAIKGGTFKSVEVIERGGETLYHVKLMRGGSSYKVELTEDGTIRRTVREARAEIEIPLK